MKRFADCWYEPLTDQAAVDKAVLGAGPPVNVFLNTVGDIDMLPKVLDAASRFDGHAPSDETMQKMVEQYAMIPLWPEHAGMH